MQESRIFQDQIFQKVNSIANVPKAISDFFFGKFSTSKKQQNIKMNLKLGSKKGPTAAEEFADFLHVCQVRRNSFIVLCSVATLLVKMRITSYI